ncbi:MAG: FHA domain-containing protein [Anaerolineae bacterium]|nr:FHA domain-containing protein [Anaerolineae bacterium]
MARINVTIVSDLFDEPNQEASIREHLPVRTLMSEARREFNLPEDAVYALRFQETGKALDPDKTMEQQGVRAGAILILTRERRPAMREAVANAGVSRSNITGPNRPFLREDMTGKIFEIMWQPAVIGRRDPTNPQSVENLAVNLETFEGAKSVSRYHARMTEDKGKFYLESIADHNPAYLNGSIVRVGDKRLLMPGDKIEVGKITLSFGLRGQTVQQNVQNQSTVIGPEQ